MNVQTMNSTREFRRVTLDWVAQVPSQWQLMRIKHGFRTIGSGTTPPSNEELYYGGNIPWVNTSELRENTITYTEKSVTDEAVREFSALRVYPKNSILFAMYGATIGRVAVLGINATVNQAVCVMSDPDRFSVRYVFYGFQASRASLDSIATGGGQPNLNAEKVREHKLPCPPIEEQAAIAKYLDRETARIDSLIAEKERMFSLLEEKRAALISRLTTRGLNPDAPLKQSGLAWLGDVPAHWLVERAKNLFSVRDERSDDGSEELLTVSHLTGVTPRSEKDVYMFQADDKAGYKRCLPGDLAINTLWAWMGAMGIVPLEGIVSPDYHVYISKGQLLPEYIELLCRSRPFVAEVSRWSKGVWSSRLRLYPENFFEMRLPVPPHEEQRAIVRGIEMDQHKATKLREALQQSIGLAKERRAALITAAVTGQIPLEAMQP